VEAIRIVRSLFELSFSEAKAILEDPKGPQSRQALFGLLEERLG
jgi:hypothetical protein